ncbi:hypothetical protein GCM10009122_22360 [Fulvivirga kasyanovii]|uniref:Uncharacterized protein n=1 Tax=Fulvivirga kasyanovii TaxID=396812 RepID=A0ABW9RW73_9BACT|nr:hypothetical protein [Fulvivirga kasyanovii]MTI28442.1 hypothetical protein [Fulvivirga kasyanovii]
MFGLFKKKKQEPGLPVLKDLENTPLAEGDFVEALRYDLGKCKLLVVDNSYVYESEATGEKVSWLKMIDASTENQKVKKII